LKNAQVRDKDQKRIKLLTLNRLPRCYLPLLSCPFCGEKSLDLAGDWKSKPLRFGLATMGHYQLATETEPMNLEQKMIKIQ
jgi:hypothetical protein